VASSFNSRNVTQHVWYDN